MSITLVLAPVAGRAVALEDVPDPVFSQGMVGYGAAIDPPRGVIDAVAPVSGKLLKLMPHAYIVMTPENVGILVHLGLDTVALKGEGFTTHVSQGDDVTAGQLIITYDVPSVEAKGLNPDCSRCGHGRTRTGQRHPVRRGHRWCGYRLRRRPFHREQVDGSRHPGRRQGDRLRRRRRDRRAAGSQTGRGARPGHRIVPAGDLRRARGAATTRERSRSGRPADSPSTSTSDCPPTTRSATGPSSSTVFVSRVDFAPGAVAGPRRPGRRHPRRMRGVRERDPRGGRRRPADPRHRHRRAHRVQRAGVLAGLPNPDQDADQADPRRQRPLLRRRRRTRCRPTA